MGLELWGSCKTSPVPVDKEGSPLLGTSMGSGKRVEGQRGREESCKSQTSSGLFSGTHLSSLEL